MTELAAPIPLGVRGHGEARAAGPGLMRFLGPGILVAVGYMDPGNWATSIAGGSRYGYALLPVVLASSIVAMLFQAAAVRLGVGADMDLAQACRRHFGPAVNFVLWVFCEIAIVACNVAEVIGMAIGLHLLTGVPLLGGVIVTYLDVMLILALQRHGWRHLEAVVAALVAVIAVCFAFQIRWLHPSLAGVLQGFVPGPEIVRSPDMLYLAVAIVGATIMPHNLYLHSALVRTRKTDGTRRAKREAIRFGTIDSNLALGIAFLVNAAIMVVAAGAFHRPDIAPVTELADAHRLLSPLLGIGIASALFGVALVASGLSSSVTGTLAGQIVLDGFLRIRIPPAVRAVVTRSLAIAPAMAVIAWFGDSGATSLLVFSQVVLSLQLPFAVGPLLLFTTRRKYLGALAFAKPMASLLWAAAALVVGLNAWTLYRVLS